MEPVIVGAVGKVKIQPFLRDFQAEGESPAVGLFYGAAFSTALLPINSAKEPSFQNSTLARCIARPPLEGFRSSGFMISNSAGNAVIEASRVDSSFKLRIA